MSCARGDQRARRRAEGDTDEEDVAVCRVDGTDPGRGEEAEIPHCGPLTHPASLPHSGRRTNSTSGLRTEEGALERDLDTMAWRSPGYWCAGNSSGH